MILNHRGTEDTEKPGDILPVSELPRLLSNQLFVKIGGTEDTDRHRISPCFSVFSVPLCFKKINKFLYLFPLLLFLIEPNLSSQVTLKKFHLYGQVKGLENQFIFFSYRGLGNDRTWDSTIIKNGRFEFEGIISQPAKSLLTTLPTNRTSTVDPHVTNPVFIEPGSMMIILQKDNFRRAVVTGSKSQNEFLQLLHAKTSLLKILDPLINKRNTLEAEFERKSTTGVDSLSDLVRILGALNSRISSLSFRELSIDKAFFNKHPDSYISVYKIVDDIRHFSLKQLRNYYAKMSEHIRLSEYGLELAKSIENLSKGSPGAMAANFSATDLNGKSISLSEYKGKYILLDFWASWCKPCRAGNPQLRRLYNIYHPKGIEFIGLSNDDHSKTEDKWRAAISTDGIDMWEQVLEGDIGDLYHIQGLPTKVLINPSGKIIGRYGGDDGEPDENLLIKLKKLFDTTIATSKKSKKIG